MSFVRVLLLRRGKIFCSCLPFTYILFHVSMFRADLVRIVQFRVSMFHGFVFFALHCCFVPSFCFVSLIVLTVFVKRYNKKHATKKNKKWERCDLTLPNLERLWWYTCCKHARRNLWPTSFLDRLCKYPPQHTQMATSPVFITF